MKVLFVSSGNSKNGISPFIKDQSESLIKNGIEVTISPTNTVTDLSVFHKY